jgi:hypothetical protein
MLSEEVISEVSYAKRNALIVRIEDLATPDITDPPTEGTTETPTEPEIIP